MPTPCPCCWTSARPSPPRSWHRSPDRLADPDLATDPTTAAARPPPPAPPTPRTPRRTPASPACPTTLLDALPWADLGRDVTVAATSRAQSISARGRPSSTHPLLVTFATRERVPFSAEIRCFGT